MLAELMRMKYGIAVGGSHGKTTTTSLIAAVLARGGLDPTVVVGGRLRALGSNARLGHGQFLVAEADESDGSFLRLSPAVAVVTNIDREHLDHYGDLDAVLQAFVYFANRVPFYGVTVLCADDPQVRRIVPRIVKRTLFYGTLPETGVRGSEVGLKPRGARFLVHAFGREMGEIEIQVPGRHNVLNALAAVAVGLEVGVGFGHIGEALAGFHGVARRFETRGEVGGVRVVDDYGHHPTEIRATLSAARGLGGRVLVVFQPPRFSRTARRCGCSRSRGCWRCWRSPPICPGTRCAAASASTATCGSRASTTSMPRGCAASPASRRGPTCSPSIPPGCASACCSSRAS